MQNVCLQTYRSNRISYKLSYFLRKIQTLRVNKSRILTIKNAKFSGYYFYMNFTIWEDFQICISIPLMFLKLFWKFWKNSRNSFVMEFLFRKLRAYKLQTSAVCVSKVLENSSSKDYSWVTFYRSRRYRLSCQIAVLNSFLENFQGGLQAHLKKTPHGYVTGKFPKVLLRFVSRTNFITPTRLKLIKK